MRIVSALALAFLLDGCSSVPLHRESRTECKGPRALFVVSHGWHTGIIVGRGDLVTLLPPLSRDIGHDEYVEVGWGEELFYRSGTGTPGLALRALFWSTSSVLHVVPFAGPPRVYFPKSEIVEVWVDAAGYAAALAFVAESFTRAPDGGVVRLGPSLYGGGGFYRAEGSFSAFNTCNTWVARALERTGTAVSSTTLTAEGLLSQLRAGDGGRCDPAR
jgi:uncharacterized protein (TIGR02117 family)